MEPSLAPLAERGAAISAMNGMGELPIWPTWVRLPERENYIEVQWRNPNARNWQTICAASIFVLP